MSRIGLFGHLATQFATSPENLATESLNYILQSPTARRAMVTFLGQAAGVELDERYTFRTQVGGTDAAVPDLVGFDSNGDQSLIIEAKFWAGLTDNQPVGYFNRLPAGNSGALVFLPRLTVSISCGESCFDGASPRHWTFARVRPPWLRRAVQPLAGRRIPWCY
jgi:hypothetical protein